MIEELQFMQSNRQKSVLSESHLILLILRQLFVVLRDTPQMVPNKLQIQFVQLVGERIQTAFEFSEINPPELSNSDYEETVKEAIGLFDVESAIMSYVSYMARRRDIAAHCSHSMGSSHQLQTFFMRRLVVVFSF